MDKLHIGYILWRFPYLTETFIADEIWEIQQQGVQVHLFSLLNPKSELVQPISEQLLKQGVHYASSLISWRLWWVQLVFITQNPLHYFSLLAQLLRQPYPDMFWSRFSKRVVIFLKAVALAASIKDSPIELLHTHFAYLPGAAATTIAKLLNLPVTVTIHAYDIYSPNNCLLCLVASRATYIVAISEHNKKNALELCPNLQAQSVEVIHCGLNLEQFNATSHSNNQPFSIVSVGSLIEMKGHEYLIKSCRILKAKGLDFHCQIFGGGPYKQLLQLLIHESGLDNLVTLRGSCLRPTVLEACRQSDLFVLASIVAGNGDRDGIPVALMEAAALQKPVVSTIVSGIPELVKHKVNGWLVSERNAEALAEAIITLAANKQLREQLGHNGRKIVEQEFQLKDNVTKLANLLQKTVAESKL